MNALGFVLKGFGLGYVSSKKSSGVVYAYAFIRIVENTTHETERREMIRGRLVVSLRFDFAHRPEPVEGSN